MSRNMPSFNIDIHFGVYCGKCGKPICGNCKILESKSGLKMSVEPCQECLTKEYARGVRSVKSGAIAAKEG